MHQAAQFTPSRAAGDRGRPRPTAGFTLAEMLIVIAIIGALAATVVYYLPGVLKRGRTTVMVVEVDQLAQAIMAYKEKRGNQYPPCMADTTPVARKVRFMRHVQAAFANSAYGTAAGNFDNLANGLKNGNNASFSLQPYNYKNEAGDLAPLDLNTLDQAEALVFWLGGFPTPYDTKTAASVANRKIFGFHRDADAPFKRDTVAQEGPNPMQYRSELYFQFKESQLVDQDKDGWYEYLATEPTGGAVLAPIVYFDADSYTTTGTLTGTAMNIQISGYPRPDNPGAATLASLWGMAAPMAEYIDETNTSPMRWHNPESFQLICSGEDGKYSAPTTGDLYQALRIIVYPKGQVYERETNFGTAGYISKEEQDNVSNLSKNTLEESRKMASK